MAILRKRSLIMANYVKHKRFNLLLLHDANKQTLYIAPNERELSNFDRLDFIPLYAKYLLENGTQIKNYSIPFKVMIQMVWKSDLKIRKKQNTNVCACRRSIHNSARVTETLQFNGS